MRSLCVLVITLGLLGAVQADEGSLVNQSFMKIAADLREAVVKITTTSRSARFDPPEGLLPEERWGERDRQSRFYFRWPEDWDEFRDRLERLPRALPEPLQRRLRPSGTATGVVWGPAEHDQVYIVTVAHAVRDAKRLEVTLADGRIVEADLVATDEPSDLALLQADVSGVPPVRWGDSDQIGVGQWVMAMGHPSELDYSVSVGVISGLDRQVSPSEYGLIQTDVAMGRGSGGGPLVDMQGEVIGLLTARTAESDFRFAIPSNQVRFVISQLVEHGRVKRGWLGVAIQEVTPDLAEAYGMERLSGALVSEVIEDSPASRAGIENGDLILEVGGTAVRDGRHLRRLIGEHAPGSRVEIQVRRVEEDTPRNLTIPVELGARPKEAGSTPSAGGSGRVVTWRGLTVQPLTESLAEEFGYEGKSGVLVADVKPDSPADRAGLRRGDLILEVEHGAIEDEEDFLERVNEAKGRVLLRIRRGTRTFYTSIR